MTQPLTGYGDTPLAEQNARVREARVPHTDSSQVKRYFDTNVYNTTSWTVPQVLGALNAHFAGQFRASAMLAEEMGRDDAYDAVMQTRTLGLISRPMLFTATTKGHKTRARQAAEACEEYFPLMCPEPVLAQVHRWGTQFGLYVAQCIWTEVDGYQVPTLQFWHPSLIQWDWSNRCLVANTTEGPQFVIPGTGQWFVYAPNGLYRGWVNGTMNSCAVPWIMRSFSYRDWARYSEVHGLPTKVMRYPAQSPEAEKAIVLSQIANLSTEPVLTLPQPAANEAPSWQFELVEATSESWKGFQAMSDMCATRFAIRVLGQNLTTEVEGGSFAAAQVHDTVRLDYVKADSRNLGGALRDFLLSAFCEFNFNDYQLAPTVSWKIDEPEDAVAKSTARSNDATTFSVLKAAGAPFDERAFLAERGFTLAPEVEEPMTPNVVPPEAVPAPAPTLQ